MHKKPELFPKLYSNHHSNWPILLTAQPPSSVMIASTSTSPVMPFDAVSLQCRVELGSRSELDIALTMNIESGSHHLVEF